MAAQIAAGRGGIARFASWGSAALAVLALAVLVLAFVFGRMTASAAHTSHPSLLSVTVPHGSLGLEQLSDAAPVPALAQPAAPVVRTKTVPPHAMTTAPPKVPAAKPRHHTPRHAARPAPSPVEVQGAG